MNFNRIKNWWGNLNLRKTFARLAFLFFFIAVIVLNIINPSWLNSYANGLLVLITGIYAFLTYEILMSTREAKNAPYLSVDLLVMSKIPDDFTDKNREALQVDELFKRLKAEQKSGNDFDKNLVFVRVKNIGECNAIDIKIALEYKKQNLAKSDNINPDDREFGALEKRHSYLYLLEVFDAPVGSDYLQIKKFKLEYGDIGNKHNKGSVYRENFSRSISSSNLDDDVTVIIRPKA